MGSKRQAKCANRYFKVQFPKMDLPLAVVCFWYVYLLGGSSTIISSCGVFSKHKGCVMLLMTQGPALPGSWS